MRASGVLALLGATALSIAGTKPVVVLTPVVAYGLVPLTLGDGHNRLHGIRPSIPFWMRCRM